jgi:hypothetical protein
MSDQNAAIVRLSGADWLKVGMFFIAQLLALGGYVYAIDARLSRVESRQDAHAESLGEIRSALIGKAVR